MKFSPLENEVLQVLGRRKMTITEITKKVYAVYHPLDANNAVAGMIRRINRKCQLYELPWFLNSQGGGRAGKTVWKDKK